MIVLMYICVAVCDEANNCFSHFCKLS